MVKIASIELLALHLKGRINGRQLLKANRLVGDYSLALLVILYYCSQRF